MLEKMYNKPFTPRDDAAFARTRGAAKLASQGADPVTEWTAALRDIGRDGSPMMGIPAMSFTPARDVEQYGRLGQKLKRQEEEALANEREDRNWEREKRNWQRDSWKRSKDMMDKMSSGGGLSAGGNYRVSGV